MARIGTAYFEIEGDLSPLNRAIAQGEEKLKRVSRKKGEPKLDLDTKDFDAAYKEGVAKMARLERKKARAVLALDTRGIAVAETEIAALKKQMEHLRGEIKIDVDRSALSHLRGLLVGGAGGGGGIFGGLLGVSGYKDKFALFAVAAASLAGALNSVAAAALAVGASLAPLAGLLAAIPGAIAGVAQAGGALFATFAGIPAAVKAAGAASTKSATDDTAALEQQRSATEAVRTAKLALTNTQRQATDAQEALTAARKDASRTLADMKNQAKDAALAEKGSALALREARAELDRVAADPQSSQLDLERAQLGVEQARQSAKEARLEATRAKADSDRAQAGGVDKTPQVVSAKRQLAEANRSVTESTRQLSRAQQQAAVKTSGLSSSEQKLKEEMDKLSPAGQRFVRYLVSLKPAFQSIRTASQAAALPHFQKGIEGAMKNLPTFRRSLTATSRTLSVAAENFGKFLGSKGFGKDFQIIARANNNVMRNLGRALVPLSKAFTDISVAAAPFTRWLGRITLHLARLIAHSAKAGRESGGLAQFLHRTRRVMESLGRTIGNLVHGFGGLFKEAFPEGLGFLKLMERLSDKFDDWANSVKGHNDIRDFFERAKGPLSALGDSLGRITRMVRDLLAAPGSGRGFMLFVRAIGLLADGIAFLARIPGVGGAVANLALIAVVAGRYGKLGAFAKGLSDIAGGLRGVTAAEATAGGSGLRRFGQSIRNMLTGLGKTRVGETIASNISAGLGVGAIKFRRALDRLKGLMSRILGRAGIAAGTSAAEGAAGQLGASGGLFRRSGGRLGRVFGRAFAVGVLAGIVLLGAWVTKKILTDWRQPIHEVGRKVGEALVNGIIKSVNFGVGLLNKILPKKLELGKVGEVDLRDFEEPMTKAPKARTRERGGKREVFIRGRWREEHTDEQPTRDRRTPALPRTKTVEIQTPVLSLKAKDVERSMNRIQTVLRRELGQARRLIERQVDGWQDVFKGFRLLRGDDPLHLGSGIKRSAEDARKAIRGIVESLGRILERLSVLFRVEGRESIRELSRSLAGRDVVSRVARMREEVVQELGKMKRQGSVEARGMVANLRETFSRLPEVVKRSTGEMLRIVLTAMRALGATGRGKIVAAVDKIEGKAMGGFVHKAQGGYIPGQGLRDTVPLELPPGAVVETRHQQPIIDFALQMADRLRFAVGGLVPVMAAPGERVRLPQDVPRVEQALALTAAEGLQPFHSLGEVFQTIHRPHYLAQGGAVPDLTQRVFQRVVPASFHPKTLHQDVVQRYQRGGEVGTTTPHPSPSPPFSRGLEALSTPRFAKGGKVRGIVPIPGQPGESIHSSIVKQVVSLVRRYKLRVTDGYAPTGHAAGGEHPKGLAIDAVPGEGGSWDKIDKLAAWAEPTQGSPRAPFRWVGYTGDAGHGRGNHLHLSWGGDGGSIETTPRIRAKTKGPRGAVRELVSSAVEKVKGAANRKLQDAEGVLEATGSVGKGGPLGKPTQNMKLGRQLMRRLFPANQWSALRTLWQGESGWKTTADNPTSDAYGIPQALPGSKMRSAGRDWETNPATQIKWGLRYIKDRYGTPAKALAAWSARSPHWYEQGGFVDAIQSFAAGGPIRKPGFSVPVRRPRRRKRPKVEHIRSRRPDRQPEFGRSRERVRAEQPLRKPKVKHVRVPHPDREQKFGPSRKRVKAEEPERRRAQERGRSFFGKAASFQDDDDGGGFFKLKNPLREAGKVVRKIASGKGVQFGPVRLFDKRKQPDFYKRLQDVPAFQLAMAGSPAGRAERLLTLTKNPRYARMFTAEQRAEIKSYGESSRDLNRRLRLGEPTPGEQLKHLDTAFIKRLPRDRTLYRGVDPSGRGAEQFDSLKPGEVFSDPAFGSTSIDPGVAGGFGTQRLGMYGGEERFIRRYKIQAKRGTSYLGIGGDEREVLLPRGRRYKVVGRHKVKDGEQVTLQMLRRGGFVSRARGGIARMARGGFVSRPLTRRFAQAVPAFASGGVVSEKRPPGAAARPPKKSRRHERRPGGGWLTKPKPYRKPRVRVEFPTALIDQFEGLWNVELAEGSPLLEDYTIAQDDASLVDEVFLVDAVSGTGAQTVDWTAVRIRIGELTGLQEKASAIRNKMVTAQGLALQIIAQLKATMETQLRRIAEIYKKLTANLSRLVELRARLKRQEKHLDHLRDKKHKDKHTKRLIEETSDAIKHTKKLIDNIGDENVELGGERFSMPRSAEAAKGGQLQKIWEIGGDIQSQLDPSGTGEGGSVASSLIAIQGSTGRGGALREKMKEINAYSSELTELQPGGKLVTPGAATAADTSRDVSSFFASIVDLLKTYGSNIRPFSSVPKLAKGGKAKGWAWVGEEGPELAHFSHPTDIVSHPLSKELLKNLPAFAEGTPLNQFTVNQNNVKVDPRTGALKVVVELKEPKDGKKGERPNVTQNISFETQPKDMHTYTRSALHELQAVV